MLDCKTWLRYSVLREKNLDATVAAIRQGLFLRFYGHEFDALTRDKILAVIEQAASCGTNGIWHHFLLSPLEFNPTQERLKFWQSGQS